MAVFFLKYRPQKISELDSPAVGETLTKILGGKDIPQAMLFAGPKGSGKTSAARIVARFINCLKPEGVEPCNKCANCLEILKGNSIDIIEIDAASNRGIVEVRALKERAYLVPSRLKVKVFIIDEAHMMTREAFNALLKLIEEPPKATMFIMCTTDENKIPETIISRLVKVSFKKGSKKELERALARAIAGEKIKVEKEAIAMILDKSDGSFRNLHKLFNEICWQLGGEIKAKDLTVLFEKTFGDYREEDLEKDVERGEVKLILEKLESLAGGEVDFKKLRERLIGYFQKRLLMAYGVGEDLKKVRLTVMELKRLLDVLIAVGKWEGEVTIGQLPLELAIVEYFGNKGDNSPVKVKAWSGRNDGKVEGEKKVVEKEEIVKERVVVRGGGLSVDLVSNRWGQLLATVRPFNHSVEAFLRAARPKKIVGGKVIFEVFYPFHKQKLEEAKNREVVEKALAIVYEEGLSFECVLAQGKKGAVVISNETPLAVAAPAEVIKTGDGKDDIYEIAKEIFG